MKTRYNEKGEEIPDPTPIEVPIRFRGRPLGTLEEVKQAIAQASEEAARAGDETFEESMDFETGEEDDLPSVHEIHDQNEDEVLQFLRAQEARQREELEKEVDNAGRGRPTGRSEDDEGDFDEGRGDDREAGVEVSDGRDARSSERGRRPVRSRAEGGRSKGKGRAR